MPTGQVMHGRKAAHFALVFLTSSFASVITTGCGSNSPPADGVRSESDGGVPGPDARDGSPSAPALVIFTSRATFTGDLGGISGADKKCQTFAEAAGLSGTFQAWLSDSKTDAIDRVPEGGPWKKLRDGALAELVFATRASWRGFPADFVDLFQDERGTTPTGGTPPTWTGTNIGGTKAARNCLDWTSANPVETGAAGIRASLPEKQAWTQDANNACSRLSSLLCYQVR